METGLIPEKCENDSGEAVAMLCDRCAGKCPYCESTKLTDRTLRLCDECASLSPLPCILCGRASSTPAYVCEECYILNRTRDGCPRIVNTALLRADAFFSSIRKL